MENNYKIVKFVRYDEIEASGTWIFKKMLNILEDKFGNINKDDCYWLINKMSFYRIWTFCNLDPILKLCDIEYDIECDKNRVSINGIDVSFTDDLTDEPLLFEIKLVYEKPIFHHIYANNYPFISSRNLVLDNIPEVKKIIFNDPATIVYWKDGTKTIVKCQKGDDFDLEKGFAMAFLKKCWGNTGNFNDKLRKIMKEAK